MALPWSLVNLPPFSNQRLWIFSNLSPKPSLSLLKSNNPTVDSPQDPNMLFPLPFKKGFCRDLLFILEEVYRSESLLRFCVFGECPRGSVSVPFLCVMGVNRKVRARAFFSAFFREGL
ncbi:rpoC2 protein product [Corchorus olitorius]|uniref:RpoC2 protein product n=1 Tax=Corchorus olitorius TaxID=93759 RepID=A0A1R3IXL6_9ROSI|nr:rpoC2 protein product [Corchorus olitorius]